MLLPLVTLASGTTPDQVKQEATYSDQFLESSHIPQPVIFYEAPLWTYDSCVEFAKWRTGKQGVSWGAAGEIEPTTTQPEIGGFGLTSEGPGHLFVITEIKDGWIKTDEANLISGERTSRWIKVDDTDIRGFLPRNWGS